MMAGKAELFDDQETREKILASRSPKQIKELGRRVKGFEQATWDKAKFSIVLNGNWGKISQNIHTVPAAKEWFFSPGMYWRHLRGVA